MRKVLGTHVKQAGSVVAPDRLRFDVTHYTAMDAAEIEEVERLVNEQILRNTSIATDVMSIDDALKTGAMALFGEKYGDKVRVVRVSDFSTELCGGTHVGRTGDIGVFKITSESGISAGVRRLEAVTGTGAYEQYKESVETIERIASIVRSSERGLVESIERLSAEHHDFEREIDRLKTKLAQSSTSALAENVRTVKGVKVIAAKVDGLDRSQMRSLADSTAEQDSVRRRRARGDARRERGFDLGRHQGPRRQENSCGEAGGSSGAGCRWARRRPARYGRSGRQEQWCPPRRSRKRL